MEFKFYWFDDGSNPAYLARGDSRPRLRSFSCDLSEVGRLRNMV
jgi:hypothetical protein